MEKFTEIIKRELTWEEILKYDKYFLKNPVYMHMLKKHIKEKERKCEEQKTQLIL